MCSRFLNFFVAVGAVVVCGCSSTVPVGVPPPGNLVQGIRQSTLQPGPPSPVRLVRNPVEGDAEAIETGKRLFNQFNCAGCHAGGGGAIGPALIDDQWIYGSGAGNIFSTIIEGRPQGMPAFGGRISEDQTWKIVAFVRSIAGVTEEPAPSPSASGTEKGKAVFLHGPCVMCHTIRGTPAGSRVGPDLTHLASRKTIAAGTLPNSRGHLAGWILNPHNLKPGTQMPASMLESQDLHALLDYLETLK